ncbi:MULTISPECIES: 4-hydroxybenzoate 3-monooxygenase [Cryobacterium]|uniref:4-hydroxybenzoate 3-monooxygenase n=1 Tax=Cryobacterium glucosi TaxID=1259175 RepID=A0ABY2IP92_9MICO|nr:MULTISPECIES: 4-hydroxybenzoate 3-monooxygenase [Cryobacterium]MDY7527394.1 4-hydroxybenzoate 3-monooxygenase [Cryobacterium sp. 10C2]MDY7556819.1 4-hydroxybenzoate 3-monooxygenase [Cryobacterium sp. 10C3]MEB0004212.1 4-hydroxybenzoate 3-monooxygenase [Cryobacterium sp. RTC2.1]MEB0286484.1 4-hydroxybenzoate 3-monooxygenase [Cryobacterium sp. 10S3]MEB0290908.1 4-hydroxybenzoate 3-monooxygenase [Cryobacterium sp. 10C2]
MSPENTRVAIIGAGPAGLLLSWALRDAGIDSIVVENRSQDYVLARIRAGVLEQSAVETLTRLGLGERIRTEGLEHDGIYLQFRGERHHVDFQELIGRSVTVYGQQEVVKDLIAAHNAAGSTIYYEAADVAVHDLESSAPRVTFTHAGEAHEITADFVVGADGFHGVCRASIPREAITLYDRSYPYAWLGILANVAPSTDELIYALHEDGFAMHSMRSPHVSRLYLQVDTADSLDQWPDERIWENLHARLGVPGWTLQEGEITDKSITPMRSFVASRLAYGSLFLAGDAGHIVPPTGAKGLNSAIADVTMLAAALAAHYADDDALLSGYGEAALRRQWRVQQFSQWMTDLLHRNRTDLQTMEFDYQSQLGRLDYVTGSVHAQRELAEQYSGLPF